MTDAAPVRAWKGFDADLSCRGYRFEVWKPVAGLSGLYEVSSLGRVRSLPRDTVTGRLGGRILKPSAGANGYLRVTMSMNGVPIRQFLHRVVLKAFIGDCPATQECRHLDGDRSNCALSNLAWGTKQENAQDRLAHGTHVDNRGEKHPLSKISNGSAADIRKRRRSGEKLAHIAADYGISIQTVCRIGKDRGWTHV